MKDYRNNPLIKIHRDSIAHPKLAAPEREQTTKGHEPIQLEYKRNKLRSFVALPEQRNKYARAAYYNRNDKRERTQSFLKDYQNRVEFTKTLVHSSKIAKHQNEAREAMQTVAIFEESIRKELYDDKTYSRAKSKQRIHFNMYSQYLIDAIRAGYHLYPPADYLMYVCDIYNLTLSELFSGVSNSDKARIAEARERQYKAVIYS